MSLDVNDYDPAFRYGAQIQADDVASSAITTAKINDAAVTGAKLVTTKGYFSHAVVTNGTTAVDFFGRSTVSFAGTLTSVLTISQDGTAGLVDMYTDNGTVVQISKGSSIGSLRGSVMAATLLASGSSLKVISNTTGNAIVVATFTTV